MIQSRKKDTLINKEATRDRMLPNEVHMYQTPFDEFEKVIFSPRFDP